MLYTRMITLCLLSSVLVFTSCGHENHSADAEPAEIETPEEVNAGLPPTMAAIFDAHGGLNAWRAKKGLSYVIARDGKEEEQLVALYDRREWIRSETMEMGYDGENTWVVADTSYKGDPLFYRNLMFYFYAMPWVLADPGINYAEAEPLTFDGAKYPGVKISYDDGVGLSPKDNYYLHYDEGTQRMRWLGYTVTYRSGEVSDDVRWIEYPSWSDYGGVELPDSLVWYTVEEGQPVEPRSSRRFVDVTLSEETPEAARFAPPAEAKMVD